MKKKGFSVGFIGSTKTVVQLIREGCIECPITDIVQNTIIGTQEMTLLPTISYLHYLNNEEKIHDWNKN